MKEVFEILKVQMTRLNEIAEQDKNEPELQIKVSAAMSQIATVMADIAKKILYE